MENLAKKIKLFDYRIPKNEKKPSVNITNFRTELLWWIIRPLFYQWTSTL